MDDPNLARVGYYQDMITGQGVCIAEIRLPMIHREGALEHSGLFKKVYGDEREALLGTTVGVEDIKGLERVRAS